LELEKSEESPTLPDFSKQGTGSAQYIVADPEIAKCALIDPALDFDERSASVGTVPADRLPVYVGRKIGEPEWTLDTHPHADHFFAARSLKRRTGGPIAMKKFRCHT